MLSLKGRIIHTGSTLVLVLTMFLLAAHGAVAADDYAQQANKALTWMKISSNLMARLRVSARVQRWTPCWRLSRQGKTLYIYEWRQIAR